MAGHLLVCSIICNSVHKDMFTLLIRSTQPYRSPTFPYQARPIKLYTTCLTKSALVWSSNEYLSSRGRADQVLIGKEKIFVLITLDRYSIIARSTWPLLDQFLVVLELLPMWLLLDFFWQEKLSCMKPDRYRLPRPLARPVPEQLIRLDRVDLIGSGNLA